MQQDTYRTYTTKELEPILHACKRTLDRKCKEGIIQAKKIGKGWVVSEVVVRDLLEKGGKKR